MQQLKSKRVVSRIYVVGDKKRTWIQNWLARSQTPIIVQEFRLMVCNMDFKFFNFIGTSHTASDDFCKPKVARTFCNRTSCTPHAQVKWKLCFGWVVHGTKVLSFRNIEKDREIHREELMIETRFCRACVSARKTFIEVREYHLECLMKTSLACSFSLDTRRERYIWLIVVMRWVHIFLHSNVKNPTQLSPFRIQ